MGLFREINLSASIFLVIGNIIGVGIFTTSGLVAEQLGASPWLLGVWLLGGILAISGAACYSLLARRTPRAGGEYAFLLPTFGALPAFLSGWASLLIGFSAPIAAGSLGLSEYLRGYLPLGFQQAPYATKIVAAVAIVAVTLFISLGLRFGARLHSLLTLLNLALIVGFGLMVLSRAPVQQNLAPAMQASWSAVDISSLGSALIFVMFGYSGWNAAAYVAEEVRSPRRNIPASLILGTTAVIGAYMLVNVAYFGALPLSELAGEIAVAKVTAEATLGAGGSHFVNLLILSSILSSLTAMSIAGPRVYYAMSRDKLFPHWLSEVNPRRRLPLKAIWFQSGVALLLITLAEFNEILLYAGTIMIFFTTLTVATLLLVEQGQISGFNFWFLYRLLPIFFIVVNLLILVAAAAGSMEGSVAGAATVAAGLPVYFYYRRKNGSARNDSSGRSG